jgi:hypothetical protein
VFRGRSLLLVGVLAAGISRAAVPAHAIGAEDCTLRSVDKKSYVARNVAVLRRLPTFPGSRLLTTYSIGGPASDPCTPRENGPPYASFTTTRVYTVAKRLQRGAVVAYYRTHLPRGWRLVAWSDVTGPPIDSTFRKGAALLAVHDATRPQADRASTWTLTVDHNSYRRR